MGDQKEEQKVSKTVQREEKSIPNDWLVRPCEAYKDEHSECESIKARFHQYFIHGEKLDCSQWKTDYDNCMKYRLEDNTKALQAVVTSEMKRRYERLAPHYNNDVWKHRASPPADWNKPLPEKMQREYKDTYLDHKAREFKAAQT